MFPRFLKRGKPSKMYSLVIIHMSYCIFLAWELTIWGEQSYFLSTFLKGLLKTFSLVGAWEIYHAGYNWI